MRTTLSLDDRVLAAARARARRQGVSVGKAVSELALIGYEAETAASRTEPGSFPMLEPVDGHVITVELVDDALAED